MVRCNMMLCAAVLFSCTIPLMVRGKFIRKSQLPHEDNWISLDQNVEFIAAANAHHNVLDSTLKRQLEHTMMKRRLDESSSSSSNFYTSHSFVDGEGEYDEYQQAWRFLGWMIDCGEGYDDDDDGGGGGSGSFDGTGEGCHRFLLWAAYIDLDYTGGGIGEYQYWDRSTQSWDETSCSYRSEGSGDNNGGNSGDCQDGERCAKMDCHLEDTHFSLLGFFKHVSHDDWMEQLFKHEGMCVWSAEEYAFMKTARKAWPDGCAASSSSTVDGKPIYYAIQPTNGGGITMGLYSDTQCLKEYKGTKSVESVLGNFFADQEASGSQDDNDQYDFSDWSLKQSLSYWDDTFAEWEICHPCVAYDLTNVGDNLQYYGENDDDQYAEEAENFDCYDDAGYTNVNQCMKFMAKTDMRTATFQDLSLASSQGGMVTFVPLEGFQHAHRKITAASAWFTVIYFIISMTVLAGGIYMFAQARKLKNAPQFLRKPLVLT